MHPERIALVAGLFFVASMWSSATRRPARPTAVAGAAWAMYAMWETYCKKQGYNIRIDFIVIIPVLFVLTGWGLQSVFQRQNTESTAGDDS